MTGVIGLFVVIACAATLHVQGVDINEAGDAAQALSPLAGQVPATLFGLGFIGAALLAVAIVPLSKRVFGRGGIRPPGATSTTPSGRRRLFYISFEVLVTGAAAIVLIPVRAAASDPVPLAGAERRAAAGPACRSCDG